MDRFFEKCHAEPQCGFPIIPASLFVEGETFIALIAFYTLSLAIRMGASSPPALSSICRWKRGGWEAGASG
jgi:hypothetical protein